MSSAVITELKKRGCRVIDRENTAGVQKWWLTVPLGVGIGELAEVLGMKLIFEATTFSPAEYRGHGYTLERSEETDRGHIVIFVCKPKKSEAGHNWSAGLDT